MLPEFAEVAPQPLYDSPQELMTAHIAPEDLAARNVFSFRNSDSRARPFKLLRTQVVKRCVEQGLRIIGITSAAPHVGKTFVAANLGASLSRIADIDVCLIDLDLHRPAQAERFNLPDEGGVHDLLSGDVDDVRQVARRINDERLVVIPGFRRNVATGELLTSAAGDALFASLRALPPSTMVLVDMPPIFADDDAVIIGQRIDGYLLVVEDGRTTRRQVRDTLRILSPTPCIGTVLNRYKSQLFSDEYGYGLSYGYGAYY